jgi:hypothetical protein
MKSCRGLSLFLGLCFSTLAGAQASAKLLVSTDMDCNWKLDGQPMGLLKAADSKIVPVSSGEHRIRAATTDGVTKIRIEAEVDQGQKIVEIELKDEHDRELKRREEEAARKQAEAEAALHPTWTDPDTGLMWTKTDNGSDVDWNQASAYCSKLQLSGFSDWRLPTIDELQGINDPSARGEAVYDFGLIHNVHVKGNLQLSGWQWSSSSVTNIPTDIAGVYDLATERPGDGMPISAYYNLRALCVRRSGE